MKLIIYTHTDYLDIYIIQQDHILQLGINPSDIIIFSNIIHPIYKFNTICYTDSNPYASRVFECISKVNRDEYEYFLFCHDNDIIISYNAPELNELAMYMKNTGIDRIDLCCYDGDNIVSTPNNIKLVKNYGYYLYSVGPSIWNINTYMDVIANNITANYRNLEFPATDYMKPRYNVYNIYSTTYKMFAGRKFIPEFSWLHITSAGRYAWDPHSEFHPYVENLKIKYNIRR
jgi:hypothetical protein